VKSIRRIVEVRLLAWLAALVVGVGCALFAVLARVLEAQFDATLEGKARQLAFQIKQEPDGTIEAEFAPAPTAEFEAGHPDPEYFQVWAQDGTTMARSPSLGGADLPRPAAAAAPGTTFLDMGLPGGRGGRMIALGFVPAVEAADPGQPQPARPPPAPVLLAVARDRRSLDVASAGVAAALGGMGLLLGLGVVAAVRRVLGRGLQPLARVAEQAAAIDAGTLDARFPENGMPEDVRVISWRLNELLDRLQATFQRERRFTSDVAHELRTPISELRTAAEVALRYPDEGVRCGHDYREILDIATRMERIVANLLALALAEAGHQEVVAEPVDLAVAVSEAWRPFAAEARRRGLRATFETAPLVARGDPALLASILRNLFSNAVAYTPAGGEIVCTAGREGGRARVAVTNTTDKLEPADVSHVFEPFWRKDGARGDREHAGLGLALVAAFARLLDIAVDARLSAPGRFTMTLSFSPDSPDQISHRPIPDAKIRGASPSETRA